MDVDSREEALAVFSPAERHRLENALRRLGMRPVTIGRLAERARLDHRPEHVRQALRTDPRYVRVPGQGHERYRLRPEHRHAATLKEAHA